MRKPQAREGEAELEGWRSKVREARGFLAWPSGEEQAPEAIGRGSPRIKAGSWGCPREMKVGGDLPQALVCAGAGERRTVQVCGSQLWSCSRMMRGRGAKQALKGRNFSLDRAPPLPNPS